METINIFNISIWGIIKIFSLITLGLYIFFAFIITRQVKIMTNTLTLGSESVAKFLAFVHLVFSIFVFVTAIIVL